MGQSNIFTSMPIIPYKIIMALMKNENFCKLIYYNTMDALEKPNLTDEQKRKMIWDGDANRTDKYNIFLTNVQPNEEIFERTVFKLYNYSTDPKGLMKAVVSYRFDFLVGSKIPLVYYNGVPCNRTDVIEMEIMKTLNNQDVAGVGNLQFSDDLDPMVRSFSGIGNNYSFTGRSIIMATQIVDPRANTCL